MAEPAFQPFFILSSGRSGSTLLASMLDMHPAFHMPVELLGLYSELPRVFGFYGDLDRDFNRQLLARDLAQIGQLGEFSVAFDEHGFCERLKHAEKNLGSVIRCFYWTLLEGTLKRKLGDKTPNHSPWLPLIEKLFPQAQIIHLVRDGRDCAASSAATRHGSNARNVHELGRLWPRNNMAIAGFGERHPHRYLRIRYEDLIVDTRSVLTGVCAFLGEPFHPQMLDHAQGGFARANATVLAHHVNVTRNVMATNHGKWRTALTPLQIQVYESLAAQALEFFGYHPSGAALTLRGRSRRLVLRLETGFRRCVRGLRTARVMGRRCAALLVKRAVHIVQAAIGTWLLIALHVPV